MRLILVDDEDFAVAVAKLRELTPASRNLLAKCIEHQGVDRTRLSKAAIALEGAGFIRIREIGMGADTTFQLLPSLAGEEAMDGLSA